MAVTVKVQRASRPAVWLDTSVLVKITRARGGQPISEIDRSRATALAEVINQKISSRRLLCVESDQAHEMKDDASARKIGNTLDALTSGIRLQAELTSRHRQFEHAMRAYLSGSSEILLSQNTFYCEDPVAEVEAALRRGFIVSVRMPTHPDLRQERERAKAEILRGLEEERRRKADSRVTFEQQLEAEYTGVLTAYLKLVRRGVEAPSDFWALQGALGAMEAFQIWQRLGGKPEDVKNYFESEHLRALPWVDIQCRVHAALMTQPQAIESGDSADVGHLAVALPVAEFVVTDRKMENRLRALGLDSKWMARVYSLSRTEELLNDLERL